MAAGRAVVVSDVGALPELVDEECGWVVPADDSAALATVLSSITEQQARDRGGRARSRYLSRYTPAVFRQKWRSAVGLPEFEVR